MVKSAGGNAAKRARIDLPTWLCGSPDAKGRPSYLVATSRTDTDMLPATLSRSKWLPSHVRRARL